MKHIESHQNSPEPDISYLKEIIMPEHKDIVIFLVDDNQLYLKLLEIQFRENPNLKIKTFLTGEACIENLFLKPDVIILDYVLSTENEKALDGLQTLAIIKKTLPKTQIIMLSAIESKEVAIDSLELGASDYIVKNQNTFSQLKERIKNFLSIYSKEKELIVWDW